MSTFAFPSPSSSSGCSAELGGFAGLFDLKAAGFVNPILVSGTDGVGTKLKVEIKFLQHLFRGTCVFCVTQSKLTDRITNSRSKLNRDLA